MGFLVYDFPLAFGLTIANGSLKERVLVLREHRGGTPLLRESDQMAGILRIKPDMIRNKELCRRVVSL